MNAPARTWKIIERQRFRILQPLQGFAPEDPSIKSALTELLTEPRCCILNCSGIPGLDEASFERLRFLEQQLEAANKKLRFVFASPELRTQMGESPSARHFIHRESLLEAIEEIVKDKNDAAGKRQFIKAFVNATLRTFLVQSKTEARRGPIAVKNENKDRLLGEISGVIEVHGIKFSYAVVLSFPEPTFLKLVERLLGEVHTEIHAENQDAAAEFMNIIFGQAKLVLNLQGAGLKPQLPKIALGSEFSGFQFSAETVTPLSEGKTVVIPFDSELGRFFIEVWFPEEHADSLF